jgi:chemotaxis protein MotA
MFTIIGILVVFGAVIGGYLMEHGNLRVLLQPAELLIIGGAGAGTVLIANPLHILKKIAAGIGGVFGGSKFNRGQYLALLKTMYDLLNKARKNGIISLEDDIEKPTESPILSTNTLLMKDHHLRDFLCDTMRSAVTGTDPFELDQVVETDLEVHHHTSTQPITALSTMADSLPGLGIVAAVLGVVIVQYIVKNEDEDKSEAIPAPKQE